MDDELHPILVELVGLLNSPRHHATLLRDAEVQLDRALFPLLVRIAETGPLGVSDLADQVGRDHSTVSRQVEKLEGLGFVVRLPATEDGRIRKVAATQTGKETAAALAAVRDRLLDRILQGWNERDRTALFRLNRRLVDDMKLTEALSNARGR